jgi:hypothetical protein
MYSKIYCPIGSTLSLRLYWSRLKSSDPRPVTYGAQRQPTPKVRDKSGGTHGIPSNDGGESICIAARVRARRDVAQARAAATRAIEPIEPIEPRVDKAERGPAFRKQVIIKQRDYPRRNLYIGGQLGALRWKIQRGETDGRCAACAFRS